MKTRVAVFIDYQNVYMGARSAFCPGTASHVDGQIQPLKVGAVLSGQAVHRELVAVRIYRGLPSSERDPKGYGAAYKQVTAWNKLPRVQACTRPLNYRDPASPREKGIDVLIAVDFVLMAIRNQYDVGILFSADTDLVPALEAVIQMKDDRAVEVACWGSGRADSSPRALSVKGHVLMRHVLGEDRYSFVHDTTDYTVRTRRR